MKEHDILCPYCPDGIEMQMAMSGTHMRCPKCGSTSPVINDLHTACFTPEDIVRTVARRRYVPMQRPLTHDELLCEYNDGKPGDVYLENAWGVARLRWSMIASFILHRNDDYGVTWRCWQRRPSDAERAAAPWGGVQNADND